MPKGSVVIPTYNRAEFLRSAITSVLNQTFQDFEIIVVDDASRDNTPEVVRSFNDRRIKYIRHEVNKGDAATRNAGVRVCNGKYIAFLDDDDEWLPEKLEKQIDLLENSAPEVGGVDIGALLMDRTSGEILRIRIPKKRENLFEEMFITNCLATSCILLRKECFEKVGLFDESIPFCSDYDMWIRISKEFHFECIKEPLVKYYIHGNGSLTTNHGLVIRGMEAMLKKYRQLFALNSKGYSHYYSSLGRSYCYSGNVKKGREAFLRAIKLYPFEIRNYLNLCVSLLGVNCYKKLIEVKESVVDPYRRKK